jgi:hypothetical protein
VQEGGEVVKRIEFRLSMPNRGSWNGEWSGAGRNYSIVRNLTDAKAEALLGPAGAASWCHCWTDGWTASVSARVVPKGERLRKSDGFSGYDWMVRNILDHGCTYEPEPGPEVDAVTAHAALADARGETP